MLWIDVMLVRSVLFLVYLAITCYLALILLFVVMVNPRAKAKPVAWLFISFLTNN